MNVLEKIKSSGWPLEFKEKLTVGDLNSNVAICTLWTFRDKAFEHLDKSRYALIGQFFDRIAGITPIVRNLLANPNIRFIYVLGADKSGTKNVLMNLIQKGVDENNAVIGYPESVVDKEIPRNEINAAMKNIQIFDLTSQIKPEELDDSKRIGEILEKKIDSLPKMQPYAEPKIFPKSKLESMTMPSEGMCFVVSGDYVGEVWLKIMQNIARFGKITKMKTTDSFNVKELINLVCIVKKEDPANPKRYPFFMFDFDKLKDYYEEICTANLARGMVYTYGSRLRAWNEYKPEKIDQIQDMIEYLKKDVYRKSGVAMTWIVEDELTRRYLRHDKNSPCILLVQPNVQIDGKLHLTAYIRSNDMVKAWPQNAFALRNMQYIIAEGLGVQVGNLITVSNSAQIYDYDLENVNKILKEHYKDPWCRWDPKGYYIVSVSGDKLVVTHYSPDSRELEKIEGSSALELIEKLGKMEVATDPCHYMDLGSEIRMAEVCMKLGVPYIQDNYNYDKLRGALK